MEQSDSRSGFLYRYISIRNTGNTLKVFKQVKVLIVNDIWSLYVISHI